MKKILLIICCLFLPIVALASSSGSIKLDKAPINLRDKPSLQRGAKLFTNYCAGCHSLKYMRYNRMAKDIGITDKKGNVLAGLVKNNLIFNDDKIADTMSIAMPAEQAKSWYGVAPPDLSLVTRVRGADWLYTYLRGFYIDESRPTGVNNAVFKDVAMPHVLYELQGEMVPVYRVENVEINGKFEKKRVLDHLKLEKSGIISGREYDETVADLVNFLTYVGEPVKLERERLGVWVILFLVILFILVYLMKKEFWKSVKK